MSNTNALQDGIADILVPQSPSITSYPWDIISVVTLVVLAGILLGWTFWLSPAARRSRGLKNLRQSCRTRQTTPRHIAFELAAIMRQVTTSNRLDSMVSMTAMSQQWPGFLEALDRARYQQQEPGFAEIEQLLEQAHDLVKQCS